MILATYIACTVSCLVVLAGLSTALKAHHSQRITTPEFLGKIVALASVSFVIWRALA